jgi:ATP-binding cassette subfamily C protein LapB
LDVGALIGANILAARALQPVFRFTQLVESFVTAQQAVETLGQITLLPRDGTGGSAKRDYTGNLEFRDVAFAYPGSKVPLFERFSLAIEPGRTMLVIGANGTGKSTLARLIVGLIEPGRGEILADGINLLQIAPEWWRRQIVFLPQEPVLLTASIEENIGVNSHTLDERAVQSLVDRVGLRGFIDESADGIRTMVQDNGRSLAVGIRRRIALARALATNGSLVILDEPTESFDKDGREIMGAVVSELHRKGCTIIAFSHDRVAFKGADILVDLNSKPIPEIVQNSRPEKTTSPNGPTTASEAAS